MKKILLFIILFASINVKAQVVASGLIPAQANPPDSINHPDNILGVRLVSGLYRIYAYKTSTALSNYVTNSGLSSTLANYVTNSALSSTLLGYATTSALAAKFDNPIGTTLQYLKGDGSLGTLNTSVVPESGFLYYTDGRARLALTMSNTGTSGNATYNSTTGIINIPNYTTTVFGRSGNITAQSGDYNTSQVTENTNLYYTNARARSAVSAGQQLSYNSTTGVFSVTKKQEAFSGTTNASGIYTVTYSTAYASQPVVVPSIVTSDPRDVAMVTASSTTGFTVQVQRRVDVIGLLPTYNNRASIRVDVVVLEL